MKKVLLISLLLCFNLYSQETIETHDFNQNYEVIEALLDKYEPSEILVALDVDNALIAHEHALGSDQWFRWQMNLLGTKSPYRIADNFEELLVWYRRTINIHGATTRLTDPEITNVLYKLKLYGVPHLAVTARDSETLAGTRRELSKNQVKYSFKSPLLEIDSKIASLDEPIYYKNGLAMLSGQDKGKFLKHAIDATNGQYKVVVMIDDQLRNVNKVHAAFENSSIQTVGLRFAAEDKNVSRFLRSAKKSVHQAFLKLQKKCNLSYL